MFFAQKEVDFSQNLYYIIYRNTNKPNSLKGYLPFILS